MITWYPLLKALKHMGLNQKQHNKHILFLKAENDFATWLSGNILQKSSFKFKHERYERCDQSTFVAQ